MNKQIFCTLYNQRIRPHIDHGMLACPPGNVAEKRLLEQVQDKATAMVWGMRHVNAERRRQMLGLMTLDQNIIGPHQNLPGSILVSERSPQWKKTGEGVCNKWA